MRGWIILTACILPFAALAQTGDAVRPPPDPAPTTATAPGLGFGSQTRFWLATQTSGEYAETDERPMPGEVATLVYQRYLNSFTYPIPQRYESNSFKANSGSSP